ncbi:MAG: hypothetical protein A3I66_06690 [Burkholderiales bacterium RIFCSPLOWO2_02_FULL_57_36]|nr:MAG: hypothetical protein A3I66_06690 [Burkholderiales bacterium RIFCSPLOWO2_02_FULL_57_36]
MTARFIFLFLVICLVATSGAVDARSIAPRSTPGIDPAACDRMKVRGVLAKNAPVDCDRLAIVRFTYIDFEGRMHNDGEIMVLAAVADFVKTIFDTLYLRRFPIARARLMDHYFGDDLASMQDNNTSVFNHRPITGGKLASMHAYGLAIDLNPVQNPYLQLHSDGRAVFSPASGAEYANRSNLRPGKQARPGMAEEVVALFADNGFFVWGGDWDAPIDYQHFQTERKMAERMAKLPIAQARTLFIEHIHHYQTCLKEQKNRKVAASEARIKCIEIRKN